MNTDAQDFSHLRALAAAATPGRWAYGTYHRLLVVPVHGSVPDKHNKIADLGPGAIPWTDDKQSYENAAYIAAANPSTVIAMLDALEALQVGAQTDEILLSAARESASRAIAERDALQAENDKLEFDNTALDLRALVAEAKCNASLARLAELQKQAAVAGVLGLKVDFGAPDANDIRNGWKPLYAAAGASPEPSALQAENSKLIVALAACRDAFPTPDQGSELDGWYVGAMADPLAVPDYIKACAAAGESPQPSQGLFIDLIAAHGPKFVAEMAAVEVQPSQAGERCCNHDSDCAVHNMPAYPTGPCDCSLATVALVSICKSDVSKALLYFGEDEQIRPLGVVGDITTRAAIATQGGKV